VKNLWSHLEFISLLDKICDFGNQVPPKNAARIKLRPKAIVLAHKEPEEFQKVYPNNSKDTGVLFLGHRVIFGAGFSAGKWGNGSWGYFRHYDIFGIDLRQSGRDFYAYPDALRPGRGRLHTGHFQRKP